jgi:hypothetical protein
MPMSDGGTLCKSGYEQNLQIGAYRPRGFPLLDGCSSHQAARCL